MSDLYLPRPERLRLRSLLRFSLRTFFVLLTLLGVWLGVHAKWIRDRRELRAKHEALAAEVNAKSQALQCGAGLQLKAAGTRPFGLWLLGEPALPFLQVIALRDNDSEIQQFDDEEGKLARALFPETQIFLRTVHFYPDSQPAGP